MKSLLYSLRVLIAAGSLGGFFGGWALLAHSGKPVSGAVPQVPQAQIAPSPLRPQDLLQLPPSQLQPLAPIQSLPPLSANSRLRLRTGGS